MSQDEYQQRLQHLSFLIWHKAFKWLLTLTFYGEQTNGFVYFRHKDVALGKLAAAKCGF